MPSLRPATSADQSAIVRIVRQAHINPRDLHWPQFIVAEEDGAIVGVGQVKQLADGTRELASIAVVPAWRGRGVARAVIEALLAREKGAVHLFALNRLGRLYARFGFVELAGEAEYPASILRETAIPRLGLRIVRAVTRTPLRMIVMRRPPVL